GSGTEKRIVARRRRDEMCRDGLALAAHRDRRDDTRIVWRYDAVCLFHVLIHGLHLIGKYQDPIMKRIQKLPRMMEHEVDYCARAARQGVGPECEEVAIRLDVEIDDLLLR